LAARPAGTIRITAIDRAVGAVLWPRLASVLPDHPDVKVEISADGRMTDIVAERYDIGVRWGDQVAKDMIAVRLAPDMKQTIVGAPDDFNTRGVPATPQDLLQLTGITSRLASSGGLQAWELKNGERETQVRVEGQATFNGAHQMLDGALAPSRAVAWPSCRRTW
jgi:DNA-binding transcriptional LysR family regulator